MQMPSGESGMMYLQLNMEWMDRVDRNKTNWDQSKVLLNYFADIESDIILLLQIKIVLPCTRVEIYIATFHMDAKIKCDKNT